MIAAFRALRYYFESMAARNPQHTCALLIGSGICYRDSKGTVKKGGIRRTLNKVDGQPVPEGIWAEGDLDSMERLLNSKGVRGDDVSQFNYHERDEETNIWAEGRLEVLRRIGELFKREDRTCFILYFTGHGHEDGSWAFPVTRLASARAHSPERSADDPHEDHEWSGSEEDLTTTKVVVEAVIEEDANKGQHGAEGSDRLYRSTPAEDADNSEGEDTVKQKPAGETAMTSSMAEKRSIVSEFSLLGNNLQPPSVQENEFVKFEDVIRLWDEVKEGKGDRYLMMIIDCCYAGKWVEMINNRNRRDICIQAACRSLQICKVAKDQLSSVFTRAFVGAQNLSLLKKVALSALDHAFVLNIVSMARPDDFSPVSSHYAPFCDINFFDSFDDMYLKT